MSDRDVTIAEVARHAGVAVSTVSYVLSGKRTISGDTRRRVLDSIKTLGYHPNAGARALASKRSNVIALVLPLRAGMHVPVLMLRRPIRSRHPIRRPILINRRPPQNAQHRMPQPPSIRQPLQHQNPSPLGQHGAV